MTPIDAYDLSQLAIRTVLAVAAPAVLPAMIVGVVIALIQALTQIQEVTLTFVPKIIAVLVAIVFAAGTIGAEMSRLNDLVYDRIENGFTSQ